MITTKLPLDPSGLASMILPLCSFLKVLTVTERVILALSAICEAIRIASLFSLSSSRICSRILHSEYERVATTFLAAIVW